MTDDQCGADGVLGGEGWRHADDGAELRLRLERHRGARGAIEVLSIAGDLDVLGVSRLRERLPQHLTRQQPDAAPRLVVVDLAEVGFLDSSGVGALVSLHRRHVEAGGAFAVCRAQPQPRQVLSMTAADRSFAVHATLAEALGVVGGPSTAG